MKGAQALLNGAENRVTAFEYFQGDAEPHTLLSKAYTVIAEEDGELYGLASLDKSGNIGLLCVTGENFKRTAKLLVRALERLADKKGVGQISVLPSEEAVKIFRECGYLKSTAAALFSAYLIRGAKLKRQVLSMTVTNAVITEVITSTYWTYDRDGDSKRYVRLTLHYLYYDENMQPRSGSFAHKYAHSAPDYYEGQEIAIACAGEFNCILCKYTVLSADENN